MRRRSVAALAVALFVESCGGCVHERATVPTPTVIRETPASASAPRLRFADAMARVERGDDTGARPIFADLLRTYPELEDYHLANLAAIDERAARFRDAAALSDRLLAAHPESVWVARALVRRARVAAALGDTDPDAFVARVLAMPHVDDATRAGALLVRADLRARTSPREALALYQEVRRTPGASATAARARSDALLAAHPELLADPALLIADGTQLLSEGRLDEAAKRLEAVAGAGADRADRATALRTLARVRQRQGRLEDAIDTYRAAAEIEPAPAVLARYDLATLLWNHDRDDEAETLFTAILREAPRNAKADDAHYALGRIAELRGRAAEADAHYHRVIATGADAALVRESLWRIAWQAYDGRRFGDAIAAFSEVAAASPQDRAGARYWQGRVRELRDGPDAGRAAYRTVLTEAPDSYYAELSESRLLESAPAEDPAEPITGAPPESLTAHAYHWSRSRELHAAGFDRAAATELGAIANEPGVAGDAEVFLLEAYREIDAHHRALRLATRLGARQRVPSAVLAAYLYPRAYWPLVSEAAEAARLDPLLVLALMRQESTFDPEAVSPAAAYGLMQLIIPTAEQVGGATVTAAELTDPARNIELGTHYLRRLLDRYDGDVAKALAAYNGGEDAVAKWGARAPGSASDEFVERISFRETRAYVKAVLGNYRRYRRLYGAPGEERAAPGEQRAALEPLEP